MTMKCMFSGILVVDYSRKLKSTVSFLRFATKLKVN